MHLHVPSCLPRDADEISGALHPPPGYLDTLCLQLGLAMLQTKRVEITRRVSMQDGTWQDFLPGPSHDTFHTIYLRNIFICILQSYVRLSLFFWTSFLCSSHVQMLSKPTSSYNSYKRRLTCSAAAMWSGWAWIMEPRPDILSVLLLFSFVLWRSRIPHLFY